MRKTMLQALLFALAAQALLGLAVWAWARRMAAVPDSFDYEDSSLFVVSVEPSLLVLTLLALTLALMAAFALAKAIWRKGGRRSGSSIISARRAASTCSAPG
ncbi:hypothetical protein HGI30_20110 [Paenibacillus albicereus]|uniref:Uncharacterized protein n=1 Tax=Paenibacillus albicereus TaxID=2726185 RepID=A0A6H2GRW6_9BACL|nr:hypothetical protein [Paenibacillus albicereus]QJC50152.1 hypothetical protein HGI30_20110 [Paenibacillus albicereus]